MKKSRFTAEQTAMALRQVEAGTPVAEICRSLQISEHTFSRWKRKYGRLGTSKIRELRPPQEALRKRMREFAAVWISYGYRRLHMLLRREGRPINAKRVHWLYLEEGFWAQEEEAEAAASGRQGGSLFADEMTKSVTPCVTFGY